MSFPSLRLSEHFATVTTLVAGKLVNIFVGVSGLGCFASVIASWFWAGKASCVSVFHCVFLLLPINRHHVQFPFVKFRAQVPRPGWVTTDLLWKMETNGETSSERSVSDSDLPGACCLGWSPVA